MKKVLLILMLFCTTSVFAENVSGTYNGQLEIIVNTGDPVVKNQDVIVTDNGTEVTLTIPDFNFSIFKSDVIITASKGASGDLHVIKIKYSFLSPSGEFNPGSAIVGNNCNISLSLSAGMDNIVVNFDGVKK